MSYHGHDRQIEFDFIVAPGADPAGIGISYEGAQQALLDEAGNLVLETAGGEVLQRAPFLYQVIGGETVEVEGRYIVEDRTVRFEIGEFDASMPLVIDPVVYVVSSSYLGGSLDDEAYAVAVDSTGHAYITGVTSSANFPTVNAPIPADPYTVSQDTFVSKLSPDGTTLVYSTYIGGSDGQGTIARSIAVDADGSAYVAGFTNSEFFPTQNAYQSTLGGSGDAFVLKLNANGNGRCPARSVKSRVAMPTC